MQQRDLSTYCVYSEQIKPADVFMSDVTFEHSFADVRNQINENDICYTGLSDGLYTGCST